MKGVGVEAVQRWQVDALRDYLRAGEEGISSKVASDLGAHACTHCGRADKRPVNARLEKVLLLLAQERERRLGCEGFAADKIEALRHWLVSGGMTRAQTQLTGFDLWDGRTHHRLIELFGELFGDLLGEEAASVDCLR